MSGDLPGLLESARALDALLRSDDGRPPPVVGDEARQAVEALGGYSYQIYASALAWLDLPPGADLFLEVAEDYAVAVRDSLHATQVRRQAGTISLAAEPARAAISSFVKLTALNPGRLVRVTFLTTATIATEHLIAHRTGDTPGLQRWRELAKEGDVTDLRRVLEALDLDADARRYIDGREDERLRSELLQRIEWRCGEADQTELDQRLRERLAEVCLEEFDVPPGEGELLTPHILQAILRTCSQPGLRTRTYKGLRDLLRGATAIGMDRRVHNAMVAAAGDLLGAAGRSLRGPPDWSSEAEVPLPPLLVTRTSLISRISEALARDRVAVVHGSTGMGKTALARLAARAAGSPWNLLELRGSRPGDAGDRLLAYARRPSDVCRGVIVDDVPDLHLADINSSLLRAMRTLADRGECVVITSDRSPLGRARASLGVSEASVVAITPLTGADLLLLVKAAGGDAGWAAPLQIASRGGHPQLANALVTGLQRRGWPEVGTGWPYPDGGWRSR